MKIGDKIRIGKERLILSKDVEAGTCKGCHFVKTKNKCNHPNINDEILCDEDIGSFIYVVIPEGDEIKSLREENEKITKQMAKLVLRHNAALLMLGKKL